ncbi:hypothetical protein BH20ACT18_BH20ACT18_12150 [soil metagenome]
MATTTVRIGEGAHAVARSLARETGQSVREIVERSVHAYLGHRIIEQSNQAFERMQREESEAWAGYQAESERWQNASADTLDDEAPYPVPEGHRGRSPQSYAEAD